MATIKGTSENDELTGTTGNDLLNGLAGDDTLDGGAGNDTLDGGAGDDSMDGGAGSDIYMVDSAFDIVDESEVVDNGIDTVQIKIATNEDDDTYELIDGSNIENATLLNNIDFNLTGNDLNNKLTGNKFANILNGGLGADAMTGGAGNDTYYVDDIGDTVTELAGGGTDTILSSITFDLSLNPNVENLTLFGNDDISGTGNALSNYMVGNDGQNTLIGGAGNDTLDGGLGADSMAGGKGNDTYVIDDIGDVVVELEGVDEGNDTVQSSIDYSLDTPEAEHIENLVLIGSVNGTGNDKANRITGGDGDNVLDGGVGIDTLEGGLGSDTYRTTLTTNGGVQDSIIEVTDEDASADTDTLILTGDYSGSNAATIFLAAGLENLDASAITGPGILNFTGNFLNNDIIANAAANIIDGGAGDDAMSGGAGDDTYIVSERGDIVVEGSSAGTDSVTITIDTFEEDNNSYTLAANVENGTLLNTIAFDLTGNELVNILTGNASDNQLDGGIGADSMAGGAGNDTYFVDNTGDQVIELAGDGIDTVISTASYSLDTTEAANIENLTLTATALTATGNALANHLIGNAENNTLIGNAGNDTLDGGLGADTMTGGTGNDTYVVDDVNDVVDEGSEGGGIDTVHASNDYSLDTPEAADIENLVLLDGAVEGTGNVLDNSITGNDGNNILNGKAGRDTLAGGLGDDTYYVNLTAAGGLEDSISEVASEEAGNDTLMLMQLQNYTGSYVTLTLAAGLENIDASETNSSRLNFTGNASDNSIIGNDEANTINGGLGDDYMEGGNGNDTYVVDSFDDVVIENGTVDSAGDTLQIRIATSNVDEGEAYLLAGNVENAALLNTVAFNLTGNAIGNSLTGNAAANILDGGLGADSMAGGAGNDTYYVDDIGDTVTELAGGGTDTVFSSITFDLSVNPNVENLTLIGSDNNSGTGNALANILIGNEGQNTLVGGAGNDTLDGGAGADSLDGGIGNDTYYVDDEGDTVSESSLGANGIDLVFSSVNFQLGDNIESLTLTGDDGVMGTGNGLANTINGNDGDNAIDGGDGADILSGGLGSDLYTVDILQSGTGKAAKAILQDKVIENVDGGDDDIIRLRLLGNQPIDLSLANATTFVLAANIESLSADLTGNTKLNLTGNALDNTLTGNDANNVLNGGIGSDTLLGGAGNDTLDGGVDVDLLAGGEGDDTYQIDNVDDIVLEDSGPGIDTLIISSVNGESYELAANVENAMLTNKIAFALNGNDSANYLTGNAAANTLFGGGDNDTLDGGGGKDILSGDAGDDVYIVDNAGDEVFEGVNQGTDTIQAKISYSIADSGEIENLTLISSAVVATGNALDNEIIGNVLNNTLDGGAGADALFGGKGNDTYLVDDAGDTITESLNEGTDTVKLDAGYVGSRTTEDHVENIDASKVVADISLDGNGLANSLTGGAGNDTLDGGTGADVLRGGAGDDEYRVNLKISAGVASLEDTISELAGQGTNDTLRVSGGTGNTKTSTIMLGANLENLDASGADITNFLNLTGNTLGNLLIGSGGDNKLLGLAGDDNIRGEAGNDTLDGGAGADALDGGTGNDSYYLDLLTTGKGATLAITGFADSIADASGNDTVILRGTAALSVANTKIFDLGADAYFDEIENLDASATGTTRIDLNGNEVANLLVGNATANTLDGRFGADSLVGGAGNDTLIGGDDDGDDTLDGGVGIDSMAGGDGNDTYVVDNLLDVITETGTSDIDTVVTSITYTLGNALENLTLTGSAAINGKGNDIANVIIGNSGANKLEGLIGNDSLNGGSGNDTLDGGLGADSLIGGDGNDTYIVDNSNDIVIETNGLAAGGIDLVKLTTGFSGPFTTVGNFIENVDASALENGLTITGNALANSLTGGSGKDTLNGGDGIDNLIGGAGDDILDGGTGADVLKGGLGDDEYQVNLKLSATGVASLEDTVTELAGQGLSDTLFLLGGSGTSKASTITLGANLENLDASGADNNNFLNLTGNTLANILTGSAGNNKLIGLAGDDDLRGGAGNDTIYGGAGADVLTGGAGNDSFVFDFALNATTNVDKITDFEIDVDKILLDKTIFSKLAIGSLSADNFHSGSGDPTPADANDYIYYDTNTGSLYYDKDGSGSGAAIQFAVVENAPTLTANDFSVIA